jgi:hypothetical protein
VNYDRVVKVLSRKRFKRINKKVTVGGALAIGIFISYSITMGANCLILSRVVLHARKTATMLNYAARMRGELIRQAEKVSGTVDLLLFLFIFRCCFALRTESVYSDQHQHFVGFAYVVFSNGISEIKTH